MVIYCIDLTPDLRMVGSSANAAAQAIVNVRKPNMFRGWSQKPARGWTVIVRGQWAAEN